ncbi:hypothetical protein [Rahnella variigena]|uniref:Glycosyltransferase n=1 Tax=Rahnella variigena TaxID=574964 RepID=A0ABX9PPH1_9GAMM|nr:hypothetical protein [Rahnella variigena]RJT50273.1 hypothetical protein D6D38_21010 [Rahnella variigena]RKF66317.1 hypothetical protein CKQ54_23270 [Rahnella variigena]
MVEAQIKVVVVGHHSRRHQASQLAHLLDAHLLMDEGDNGANWNHRRAIGWASQQECRVVIMEDDALLLPGFTDSVREWVTRFPDHLISFYLGTGRPPQYQQQIAASLIDADKHRRDYITMDRLLHGVCYSPPVSGLSRIIQNWNRTKAADYAVGDALGGKVIYPCYSLVDHADGATVERHPDNQPRIERRRAWRLAGGTAWQS